MLELLALRHLQGLLWRQASAARNARYGSPFGRSALSRSGQFSNLPRRIHLSLPSEAAGLIDQNDLIDDLFWGYDAIGDRGQPSWG